MNNLEYWGLQEEYKRNKKEMSRADLYLLIDELLATEEALINKLHGSAVDQK